MRKLLLVLALGAFVLPCAACGSSSASSANGNKNTCHDLIVFESHLHTATSSQVQKYAQRLKVDGSTASSSSLTSEASLAAKAMDAKNEEQVADQLNAANKTCHALGINGV